MVEQDTTDIAMQNELDKIANMLNGNKYASYNEYEDDVGYLVYEFCPECVKVINTTTIGIFPLWTNIRNYIRSVADIQFTE
jgi:hypothetical protein